MDFVDATIVRLADPATRAAVFDAVSLEQLINAAYDTDRLVVQGPYAAIFEDFRVGYSVPRLAYVEGSWHAPGGAERVEARFQVGGLGDAALIRVDALWRGGVIARTVPTTGVVQEVEIDWPSVGTIDAEIEAALGALPAGADLERERRDRLIAAIRANLDQPQGFTENHFNGWLRRVGAASVSQLIETHAGAVHPGTMKITLAELDGGPPIPTPLPFSAALLIRDAGFSVAAILHQSKMVRQGLDNLGLERPRDPALHVRDDLLVVWVIPETVFDDEDWPGAAAAAGDAAQRRAARRAAAGAWLAREGIGLAAVAA